MVKTIAALLVLTALAPFNAAVTLLAWLRSRGSQPPAAPTGRTVLISGGKMTKALQLARCFHADGHRVVLVEMNKYRYSGHRFSRAVDTFHTVPAPEAPGYAEALLDIARRESVDVYVPVCSPAASQRDADAKALLAARSEVVHGDPDTIRTLDDKHAFSVLAASLGLSVPDHHRITDPQQVADFDFDANPGPYVLKSIPYDPVRRLDLTPLPRPTRAETLAYVRSLPISKATPFILQKFIRGAEFCTHSTVRNGEVQLHVTCASSAFALNYAGVDKPQLEAWVKRLARALSLTGQYSFDFIEAADGTIYAIECNPRTHSAITTFHDHPGVARAYLESGVAKIGPRPGSRPTYWLYNEMWRLVTRPTQAPRILRTIARGKDAIFDTSDPLPFLAVHHLQIPSLLLANLRARKQWIRIDFNIGKLIEPAGD